MRHKVSYKANDPRLRNKYYRHKRNTACLHYLRMCQGRKKVPLCSLVRRAKINLSSLKVESQSSIWSTLGARRNGGLEPLSLFEDADVEVSPPRIVGDAGL